MAESKDRQSLRAVIRNPNQVATALLLLRDRLAAMRIDYAGEGAPEDLWQANEALKQIEWELACNAYDEARLSLAKPDPCAALADALREAEKVLRITGYANAADNASAALAAHEGSK